MDLGDVCQPAGVVLVDFRISVVSLAAEEIVFLSPRVWVPTETWAYSWAGLLSTLLVSFSDEKKTMMKWMHGDMRRTAAAFEGRTWRRAAPSCAPKVACACVECQEHEVALLTRIAGR
jgi:hypothetical protein